MKLKNLKSKIAPSIFITPLCIALLNQVYAGPCDKTKTPIGEAYGQELKTVETNAQEKEAPAEQCTSGIGIYSTSLRQVYLESKQDYDVTYQDKGEDPCPCPPNGKETETVKTPVGSTIPVQEFLRCKPGMTA